MTTPNDTPTPRTDAKQSPVYGCGYWVTADFARTLERELAEAKAAKDKADEDYFKAEEVLLEYKAERDAARAEAAKWRECAEAFEAAHQALSVEDRDKFYEEARNLYRLCPSPPQSSPSQEPCKECGGTGSVDTGAMTPWGTFYEAPCPVCQPPTSSPQSSPPTATAPSAVESPTASRLQALESNQELLRRRTDWLLELFSELRECVAQESFKTEWPADLALPTLTSTSPATQKQSGSDAGN